MQTYKRKITYFYQFQNGRVGTTVGFLKLEIRGESVKITINIHSPAANCGDFGAPKFEKYARGRLRMWLRLIS